MSLSQMVQIKSINNVHVIYVLEYYNLGRKKLIY